MIGYLNGEVLFSDGQEVILLCASGVGHQIFFSEVLVEGSHVSLFVSHVIKEASQELYGFSSIREKKLFEMLTSVKGVGPKSAYALTSSIGPNQIIDAIAGESKSVLTKAPGIGNKAAAQIILDLSTKIHKVKMYSDRKHAKRGLVELIEGVSVNEGPKQIVSEEILQNEEGAADQNQILQDALMACRELGFKEEAIIPLAQRILGESSIGRPEQLVHLVLKEI